MSEWEQTTIQLSELSTVFTDGDWIEKKDQSLDGIRLIQTGNVGTGQFKNRQDKARFISPQTFEKLKCTEIVAGDCLISRLPDPVGRACLIPEDLTERMITAVDCSIVRFNKDLIIPKFFIYYSQSRSYLAAVEIFCTGATRKRISRKNLGKIKIPLTSLLEQERIVAVLDEAFEAIDTAIANTEKNLSNTKELFNSFRKEIFKEVTERSKILPLGKVCENLDKHRVPITKSKREAGVIPYYGASGIVDYVAEHLFDEDLLLVSEDGANLIARTYPIAFSVEGKIWVNNHAHVLKFENTNQQEFVEHYLNSISLENWVSGMAQPKLNQKALASIPIPWPSNSDLFKLVTSQVSEMKKKSESIMEVNKSKLAALEELKQSVLEKAFAGELRILCWKRPAYER